MKKILPLLSLIVLIACAERKKSKSITDQQIQDAVMIEGNRISNAAQKALGGQLKKAMGEGGPRYAVRFCQTAAYPILDTLTTGLDVKIKRESLRLRNPKDAPDDTERKILEQYQKSLDGQAALQPVVAFPNENQILFAKPIVLNNPLCLNCHGSVGTEVSSETHALIKDLYPDDNAANHKIGDLRGIWSITFDRDKLITYLEQQKQE